LTASALRFLGLVAALIAVACTGSPTPPPAPSPTPGRTSEGLRPLTSREGVAPDTASPGADAVDPASALPPGHPPIEGVAAAPGGSGSSAGSVAGTITLAPSLTVGPADILYIMAKKDGSTLAVRRVEAPTFPFAFEVSEGHAMVAGMPLEGPVDIVARVSRTGDAIPSPGDLEGIASNVPVPSTGVAVTIDRVRE
jgi:hypothetical protein